MNYSVDKEKLKFWCTSFPKYNFFFVGVNLHYPSTLNEIHE